MHVIKKNAPFYTLILKAKLRIVLGMIEVFADMDPHVDIVMSEECCAKTTWLDSVLTDRPVNSCIQDLNFRRLLPI